MKFPFVIEGMILGVLSGVISLGLVWGLYELAVKQFSELLSSLNLQAIAFVDYALPMLGIFIAIGVICGVGGSVVTMAGKRPRKAVAKKPVLEAVVQDTLADSEGDEPLSLDELEVENVGVPQWLQTHIVGDTLFIACDQAMLPRRLVVVANDGECLYKLLPQEMAAMMSMEHPTDSEKGHYDHTEYSKRKGKAQKPYL